MVDLAGVAGLDQKADLGALVVRIRWWCTAEVSSSEGIGGVVGVELRSDSTMMWAPSSMAAVTSSADGIDGLRPAHSPPPPWRGRARRQVEALKPGVSPSALT